MSIEPARASHAQNPPAACFEWLEALELWRESETIESILTPEPVDKGNTWPKTLPVVFVAAIQWPDKTPAMKARRAAFASFCETLPTVPVEWKAPPLYAVGCGNQWDDRYPHYSPPRHPDTEELNAITAAQAEAIFRGAGVEPDRVLKAWLAHHCPANTIEPAPAQPAQPLPPTPAPAAPPEAVLMPPQAPHKRQRGNPLLPLIERAVRDCDGRTDAHEVFNLLRQWAIEKPPRPPLMGVTDRGIQWLSANDEPKELTVDALGKRLKPPAKRG